MFSILLGIDLVVELLSRRLILFLTFKGTNKIFSKVVTAFYIPTSNTEFQFLHILANTYYYLYF